MADAFFAAGHDPSVWRDGWYPDAALLQSTAVQATDHRTWWAGGNAPMLVVQGLQDRIAVPENGRLLAAERPDIDVLVNCVGIVRTDTVLTGGDDLELSFRVNVLTMTGTIRAFLPAMRARGGGAIVNIASVVSSVKAAPDRFSYGVTKAAVIGLTKAVAADYVAHNIRCNAICPGTVESPSLQEQIRAQGDYEQTRAAFVARQPIGRLGTPEEIADLAVYLAGATYTTGQALTIDGGWTI